MFLAFAPRCTVSRCRPMRRLDALLNINGGCCVLNDLGLLIWAGRARLDLASVEPRAPGPLPPLFTLVTSTWIVLA